MKKKYNSKFDIAIIGAGIAGCFASIILAKKGFNICLIESSISSKLIGYRELLSEEARLNIRLLLDDKKLNDFNGIDIRRSVIKWNTNFISVKNYSTLFSPLSIDKATLKKSLISLVIEHGVTCINNTKVLKVSYENNSNILFARIR